MKICASLSKSFSSGEDMKTEPVMDSTDYTGLELRSSLIKSEDTEESIERKNGCGMSREEELILSNIKEDEEGGKRQREDGVKDEVAGHEWKEEKERNGDEMEQSGRVLKQGGLPACKKQEDEGLSPEVTSCLYKQPRVPSPASPLISSSKGNAGVLDQKLVLDLSRLMFWVISNAPNAPRGAH